MTALVEELNLQVSIRQTCQALNVPRNWYYRWHREQQTGARSVAPERLSPKHTLSARERTTVRDVLNSERFMDQPPRQVYATLLDEGQYLCHWRTMYRLLVEHDEVRERRHQRRRPHYQRPQLLAQGANEVWSWDISWLKGPARLVYFYLYVILDIFSRYVVGWMIAEEETGTLAKQFIAVTCGKQQIEPEQLTLHADRGGPMRATPVTQLLEKLGVTRSHSRPYTTDDNPFSEAQFKTMKYRPNYPERFESLEQAQAWAKAFFDWYNNDHHHVGLGLMPPAVVHYGQADAVQAQRQQVLDAAYARHPERFVQGPPVAAGPPAAVWINPPQDTAFSGPAAAETKPGAQPGSSATALEAGEHLAIMEATLRPLWEEKSSLILIGELSQSL